MDHDWRAMQAEIESDYADAKAARDKAFMAVRPEAVQSGSPTRVISPNALAIFGEANARFEAARERRSAFLRERARAEGGVAG